MEATIAPIPRYSVVLQWSPVDDAYIATIPELPGARTHDETYEEALQNAREVIDLVVTGFAEDGLPIPTAITFRFDQTFDFQAMSFETTVRRAS